MTRAARHARSGWLVAMLAPIACMALIALPASARIWPAAQIEDLADAAEQTPAEGLPAPRALDELAFLAHVAEIDARFEPALDDAADALFAALADAYARGAVDPQTVDPQWRLARPDSPDFAALSAALDAGASPRALLQSLLPQAGDYAALKAELGALSSDGDAHAARRRQLRANLERWRWLPRMWPERRIEVRIAQYELFLHEGAAPPIRHTVIVGAPATPSPIFSAVITSFTLNPDWTPPQNIVVNELAPRFRRDPEAAAREGFEAIGPDGGVLSAPDIDWAARPFTLRLRQRPGPANALGRLRFDLPNPYAVYLHDTPSRRLFARAERALSHGCIRVEDPVALAARLAPPGMDGAAIEAEIAVGETRSIPVAAPIPVYVLYLTVVADPDASVRFLPDIYRRDDALATALDAVTFDIGPSNLAEHADGRLCAP